jgi:putative restriction endonuclease
VSTNTQRGYIGVTYPDWFGYLAAQPRVDEVNFWRPHGDIGFRALKPGDLFFFKLRAPDKAIAGFGFFERWDSLPAWMAWDTFREMNGAPDFETFVDNLLTVRGESKSGDRTGSFKIGCIMLAAPMFFSPKEWVTPPNDWAHTGIQQGKGYDLTSGEGKRIKEACLSGAQKGAHYWNVEKDTQIISSGGARYGKPVMVRPRKGQGLFSLAVREAYGACAVTGEHSSPVLEAAHIRPYHQGGLHSVDNGLLLRRDLHRLYDLGYVTVTPDYVFHVGDRLRDEFQNGRSYYSIDGSAINLPSKEVWKPKRELLEWHSNEVFKR